MGLWDFPTASKYRGRWKRFCGEELIPLYFCSAANLRISFHPQRELGPIFKLYLGVIYMGSSMTDSPRDTNVKRRLIKVAVSRHFILRRPGACPPSSLIRILRVESEEAVIWRKMLIWPTGTCIC